jgi:SpoIIAA-like
MLRPIADLPEGVLGFEATGEIQASDYRDVLMPAVREVWERGDEVRIVLVFERWEGMSFGAAWEDLKVGMKNLTKWKRIALVTDLDWMITVASLVDDPGRPEALPRRRARAGDRLGCGRRLTGNTRS